MEPGATVNDAVKGALRCWPREPTTPCGPSGTVMGSCAPGTSGAVASYCRSEGESTAHWPATAGVSVGRALPGARSVENWTEITAPLSTLAPVGAVLSTLRTGGGLEVVAAAGVWGRGMRANPAAATARATMATAMTHRRAPRNDLFCTCCPWAMAKEMLPAGLGPQAGREGPQTGREAQMAAMIW